MLKKRVGAMIGIVLCNIMLYMSCPVVGQAQEITDSTNEVSNKSELTDNLSAEGIYIPKARDSIIQRGYINIESLGNGKLKVRGSTTTHIVVDKVSVTITLQRQVGGVWKNVTSWTASKSNDYFVSKGLYYYTTKGYKYRLLGKHYAKKGSTTRKASTDTIGIILN